SRCCRRFRHSCCSTPAISVRLCTSRQSSSSPREPSGVCFQRARWCRSWLQGSLRMPRATGPLPTNISSRPAASPTAFRTGCSSRPPTTGTAGCFGKMPPHSINRAARQCSNRRPATSPRSAWYSTRGSQHGRLVHNPPPANLPFTEHVGSNRGRKKMQPRLTDASTPTALLLAWGHGDRTAFDRLIPLVHAELHRLAHRYMAGEHGGHTLQTSALRNQAYLRFVYIHHNPW